MCCRYNREVQGGDGAAPRSCSQPLLVHHTDRLRDGVRQEVEHRISLQLTLSSGESGEQVDKSLRRISFG